jgi:hypothetical protein
MKHELIIDGSHFSDYAGFVQEFNRAYVALFDGPTWDGESFDDFDDFLEAARDTTGERLTIRWLNSQKSRADFGYEAMAAYWSWALERVPVGALSPAGYELLSRRHHERIDRARAGHGRTLFEWMVWQITDHGDELVDLKLE